jgi:hypothetical protein
MLAEQLQERRASLPKRLPGIETISQKEFDRFTVLSAEPLERERGRPPAGNSGNPSTDDSFDAFMIVMTELNAFRRKIGKKRVTAEATDKFIELALYECPEADAEIIREYLRKNNTMDIVDELKAENWRG